jgi:hypothetical protein
MRSIRSYREAYKTEQGFEYPFFFEHGSRPHGMVPTSLLHIYKVFETIHMLWMSRWIHHHITTTIIVAAELREVDE